MCFTATGALEMVDKRWELNKCWFAGRNRPGLQTLQGLADGNHSVAVRARDLAGNLDPANASYAWVVDTLPPSNCSAAPAAPLASGRLWAARSLPLRFRSQGEPVAYFRYRVDGGDWVEVAAGGPSAAPNSAAAEALVAADGAHELQLHAADVAGNVGAAPCAVVRWTADTAAPTVAVLAHRVRRAQLEVQLSSSEPLSAVGSALLAPRPASANSSAANSSATNSSTTNSSSSSSNNYSRGVCDS